MLPAGNKSLEDASHLLVQHDNENAEAGLTPTCVALRQGLTLSDITFQEVQYLFC